MKPVPLVPDNKVGKFGPKPGISQSCSDNSKLSSIQFAFLKKYLDKNF